MGHEIVRISKFSNGAQPVQAESSTTKFAVEITLNSQRGATIGPRMFNHLNIRLFEILNSLERSASSLVSHCNGFHGIKLVGTNARGSRHRSGVRGSH